MLTGPGLETLFRRYLIDHSARRINYLFWNVVDLKESTLQMVNLSGRDLIRGNNPDLIYRAVKVKNDEDWKELREFVETFLIDPEVGRTVHIIRLDFLATYLKSIKYDISAIKMTRTGFGTMFTVEEKPKPIVTMDPDIQSIYLLDNLHTSYRRVLYGNEEDWAIKDITNEYLEDPKFEFKIGTEIVLPAVENLDIVSRKYLRNLIAKDPKTRLEQIYMKNGVTAITVRLITSGLALSNTRAYLLCFPRKTTKKKK